MMIVWALMMASMSDSSLVHWPNGRFVNRPFVNGRFVNGPFVNDPSIANPQSPIRQLKRGAVRRPFNLTAVEA
jgi:hypothetical protein